MPPKSKTIGQKSKNGKSARGKSGGILKSEDKLERSVAPNSTMDPAKQSVNKELLQREKKELISSLQEQLDYKQTENEKEVRITLGKIKYLRRENERMQRKQMAEYGMTLDMMEELKETLESTKEINDKRHEDMVEAKLLHDKLDIELQETKQKFSEAVQKLNDLQKETKVWEATKEDFLKAEARCDELRRNNKKLRIILLKHHIDPCTDPRELSRDHHSDRQSIKTTRSNPDTSQRRKLTVRSRYQEVGDVELMKQMNDFDLRRGMGVMANTFDQVSPAYLGYYMKKRKARKTDYIRPGVSLPRIIYGK